MRGRRGKNPTPGPPPTLGFGKGKTKPGPVRWGGGTKIFGFAGDWGRGLFGSDRAGGSRACRGPVWGPNGGGTNSTVCQVTVRGRGAAEEKKGAR